MKFNYEHDYPINIQNLYDRVALTPSPQQRAGAESVAEKLSRVKRKSLAESLGGKKFVFNSEIQYYWSCNPTAAAMELSSPSIEQQTGQR